MSLPSIHEDGGATIVVAHADLPDPPMTLDEKDEKLAAAHKLISTKYDAGVPFFTKDSFRDIVQQLESGGNPDHEVSVVGLDGASVCFQINTGKEHPDHPFGNDYVCIMTKPILEYHDVNELLADEDLHYYSLRRAYLPVEVAHWTEIRRAHTGELVSPWPAADYATVRQRFEQARRSLERSELFAQIRSMLTSTTIPRGIQKIVALACSTLTWAGESRRSMAQHALALAIGDVLGGGGDGGLKCYAQDPVYTPVDEQVLREAGFNVLDDPRAFLEVDEESVVIAIAADIPIRQIIADIARPAIMILHEVVPSNRSVVWADPVSPRVEEMLKEYTELVFPADNETFGNLSVYIRKA
ncbi:hypothetical protein KVR01_006355 [Diaporthe batatas]|uniref:uncharacterized protein n=1 Tax=Diaporthe batatas TaxID=748121 RepID=UPI001D03CA67|nr:uncharacterized protein KVR01_006355 [Diaporthe batatas]KAG8164437.1 hypothetical protein KVR01_006355 [Diaporthe batatas]